MTEHVNSASTVHRGIDNRNTEDRGVQVYAMHFLTTSLEPQVAPQAVVPVEDD